MIIKLLIKILVLSCKFYEGVYCVRLFIIVFLGGEVSIV